MLIYNRYFRTKLEGPSSTKRATKSVENTRVGRTCFSQSIISEVLSTLVASYHSIGRFRVDNRRALSRKLSR